MKAHIEEVLRRYSYIQTALKEGKTEVNFYVGKRKQKIVIDATLKIILTIIEDITKGTVEKLSRGEETTFEDFKNTDFESINADIIDIDFFVNTMGAMIAANDPHSTRDFYDIIGEVPIMLLFDPDFIKELMSLISFGLKKNKSAFKKIFSPKM